MSYEVRISSVAYEDMNRHFYFLAQVSESAAERLKATFWKDIRSLKEMPYRTPAYNRPYLPPGKYRYLLSARRYRIVYQINNDTVNVDYIEDCRQNNETSHPGSRPEPFNDDE
jgi:mRNA-degrading endonuclease RelE of RelBE toxin-antitoxin system